MPAIAVGGKVYETDRTYGLGTKYKVLKGQIDARTGLQKYRDPYGNVVTAKQNKRLPERLPANFSDDYIYAREIEPMKTEIVRTEERAAEQVKSGHEMVYAINPRTGRTELVTRSDAILRGYRVPLYKNGVVYRNRIVEDYSKTSEPARQLQREIIKRAGGIENIVGRGSGITIGIKGNKLVGSYYQRKKITQPSKADYSKIGERGTLSPEDAKRFGITPQQAVAVAVREAANRPIQRNNYPLWFDVKKPIMEQGFLQNEPVRKGDVGAFSRNVLRQVQNLVVGTSYGMVTVLPATISFGINVIQNPIKTVKETTRGIKYSWEQSPIGTIGLFAGGAILPTGELLKVPEARSPTITAAISKGEVFVDTSTGRFIGTGKTIIKSENIEAVGKVKSSGISKEFGDVTAANHLAVVGLRIIKRKPILEKISGSKVVQIEERTGLYAGKSLTKEITQGSYLTIDKGKLRTGSELIETRGVSGSRLMAEIRQPKEVGVDEFPFRMFVKKEDIFHVMGASKTGKSINLMKGSIKTNILGSPDLGETIGGGGINGIKLIKKQNSVVGALQSELKATEELMLKNNIESTKKPMSENILKKTPILHIPELTHAHFSRVGTIREKVKKRVVTIEDVLSMEMLGRTSKQRRGVKNIIERMQKVALIPRDEESLKNFEHERPAKMLKRIQKNVYRFELLSKLRKIRGGISLIKPSIEIPKGRVVRIPKKLRMQKEKIKRRKRKKRHLKEDYSEKLHKLINVRKFVWGNKLNSDMKTKLKTKRRSKK